jgi:uncharacterized protein YndB with AHSA1/START domain
MIQVILVGVVVLLVVLVIVVAVQPAAFRVVRSARIEAPPADVFARVNDFHEWDAWSPWAKLDPASKSTFEGPAAGTGAVFGWSGNTKVGAGRMTVTESRPAELIRIRLEFMRPFKCTNVAEFAFRPEGGGTVVTWSMSGEKIFFSKAFGLVMDMDKMVGGDFEKGLGQMKMLAEAAAGRPRAASV